MKGIKVISDGSILGTKVYIIDENGKSQVEISSIVKAVYWEAEADQTVPRVILKVVPENIEIIGKLRELIEET